MGRQRPETWREPSFPWSILLLPLQRKRKTPIIGQHKDRRLPEKQTTRAAVAIAVFITAIVAVSAVIALTQSHITGILRIVVPIGWVLIAVGCVIDIWALVYLKLGVAGRVAPLLHRVEHRGPYRYVRHPVYLGLILILAGIALRLGSWLGVAATILLFLPAVIYRAFLEEEALALRFGKEWDEYRMRTGLLVPRTRSTQHQEKSKNGENV